MCGDGGSRLGYDLPRPQRATLRSLADNRRARRVLVEAAWAYRYPAGVAEPLKARLENLPKAACDIAWKVQIRLCARCRRLSGAGIGREAAPA